MNTPYLPSADLPRFLRRHAVTQTMIPLECRTGWWVPVQSPVDHTVCLAGFFYRVLSRPSEPIKISRPLFHYVLNPALSKLVAFTDCAYADFAADLPAPQSVPDVPTTVAEMDARHARLYTAYDGLLPCVFTPVNALGTAGRTAAREFRDAWEPSTQPDIDPFYHALNPAFFDWLMEATAEGA
jgi:hypothetical protein